MEKGRKVIGIRHHMKMVKAKTFFEDLERWRSRFHRQGPSFENVLQRPEPSFSVDHDAFWQVLVERKQSDQVSTPVARNQNVVSGGNPKGHLTRFD